MDSRGENPSAEVPNERLHPNSTKTYRSLPCSSTVRRVTPEGKDDPNREQKPTTGSRLLSISHNRSALSLERVRACVLLFEEGLANPFSAPHELKRRGMDDDTVGCYRGSAIHETAPHRTSPLRRRRPIQIPGRGESCEELSLENGERARGLLVQC